VTAKTEEETGGFSSS